MCPTYSMCRNSIPDSIYHIPVERYHIPRDIWASTSRYDPPAIWAEINYGPSKWSGSSCNGQPPLRVNQPMLLPPSLHTLVLPPGPRSPPHPHPCPPPQATVHVHLVLLNVSCLGRVPLSPPFITTPPKISS